MGDRSFAVQLAYEISVKSAEESRNKMGKGNAYRPLLTVLLMLAVPEFTALSQSASANGTKSADEQDIYAVVIRSHMEEWIKSGDKSEAEAKDASDRAIAQRLNFRIFFVEIDGKDPSDDFIKRFADVPRTIKKVSEEVPNKGPHQPIDKSTRRAGIVFSAEHLRWSCSDSVELEGGYYCGGLCAAGTTYKLRRENGKWVIKSSQMNWIS